MGTETDPSSHITELCNIYLAQTGEAYAIMMNNKLKQDKEDKAGVGFRRLSDVNLLSKNL